MFLKEHLGVCFHEISSYKAHLSSIALKAKESLDDFKNEDGEIDELSIRTRSLNKM